MKIFTQVNRSQGMIRTLVGLKSRITSTKPLLTMLALLMVALFGVNEKALALRYGRAKAYSSPAAGGWVWVTKTNGNAPSKWEKTSDESSDDNTKIKDWTFPFYYYANAQTNYTFLGWATSSSTNTTVSTTQTNWYVGVTATSANNVNWNYATVERWALFGRLTANKSSETFGSVNVGSTSSAKEVKVTYVHAGKVTATLTGDFSFESGSSSKSKTLAENNTDSEVTDQSINIYFKPTCNSTRNGKLTIKSSNGLTDVEVNLSGTGNLNSQTLSWNNESQINLNMLNGTTQNISASATSGLTVSYESSNTDVLSVDANGKLTAKAVGGPVTITAKQAGDCTYSAATSITKTFYVKTKDTPSFSPSGFSAGTTNALKVDDEVTLGVSYVSDGLNGDFRASATKVNNQDILQITRNGNTITIKALREGTSTVTFTQTENDDIFGATQSYTFTVTKVDNTLALKGSSYNRYVEEDDDLTSFVTTNSNGTVHTSSTATGIAHYDIANNAIVIDNSSNTSFNSTSVTIKIWQDATVKYAGIAEANAKTVTLTVKKYDNTIYVKGNENYSNSIYVDSYDNLFTFTATNEDYTHYPIQVTQSTGTDIATYYPNEKVVYSSYKLGTATWSVTQPENYKYKGGVGSFSISVDLDPNCGCNIATNAGSSSTTVSSIGNTTWTEVGVADKLYYQLKKRGAGGTGRIDIGYKDNGETKYEGWKEISTSNSSNYEPKNQDINDNAVEVQFSKGGIIGTDDPYIKDVRITRKRWFDIKNAAGNAEITELTMPTRTLSGESTVATFKVDYSTCAPTIKVASNNSHIVVDESDRSFSSTTHGVKTITLRYNSDVAEKTSYTITVYTKYERKTLTVNVETKDKLATHLVYKGAASYSVDAANIAATDLFEVQDENNDVVQGAAITLSSGTASSVTIANDSKSIASLCGNSNDGTMGNIIASYAGDNTHAAATNNGLSQNFTINRLNDEVSFVNGKSVILKDDEYTLSTWASAISGTTITYTSSNESVIKVEGGKLKAVGKGTATLTATSAGNCVYNAGSKALKIKVRISSDPCETLLLDKPDKLSINLYAGTVANYTIADGPQDKLTFKVWKVGGATWNANVYIKNANGTQLKKFQYESGSLSADEPTDPNVEIDLTDAELAGAKTIEIDGSGTLYKYISDLKVSQKSYLIASTSSVTMSTVKACETAQGQFTVSYSDLSRIQLSQTNPNFTYEVWDGETKLDGFNNDCGDYGTYTVKFFYIPQGKGGYSNTVTLTASGKEQVITLSGTANAPEREIVWDIPTGNTISATQSVDLTAYAQTDCESPAGSVYYTYSSAVEGAATIEGSTITFNKAATVTVTAHTVVSDMYEDAETIEKVWTVGKLGTQMRTLPTITSTITYGDNSLVVSWDNKSWAAEDVLSNEKVEGSISYVGPASFTSAGDQNLTFNFSPNDVYAYDVCQFTVPVTVQKMAALQVPVALSFCKDGSAEYRGTTYTEAGTYPVNAEGVNRDTVYNVTVTVLQPTVGADSKTITVGAEESWNEIDLSGYAVGEYEIPFHTMNAVGCDSTVTLNLTVNKIETLPVPVALSFCAGGSEEYRGTTYTKAGTYPVYAEGATRDTVYTVTVTVLQPTTGTDSKIITYGDEESWHGTDLSNYTVGDHEVFFHTENVAGCDSTVTLNLTVNKANPTLAWSVAPTNLAYNGTATYTAMSASNGAITYAIVEGGSYASIDENTGVLSIIEPGYTVTVQASQAEVANYNAPEAITVDVVIAAAPVNEFTNANGDGDWTNPANWSGNAVPEEDTPIVIVSGELVISDTLTVSDLTIEKDGGVTIVDDGKLIVTGESKDRVEYGDIHVMDDGELELKSTARLEVRHFTLDAKLGTVTDDTKRGASGQVDGTEKLNVNGSVYFDLQLDPGTRATYGWYTFTVPFEVNVAGGIYRLNNDGSMTLYQAGRDFIITRYDEAKRARGEKGWVKVNSGVLQSGIAYNITVDDEVEQNILRFVWNKNNTLGASYSCPLQLSASTTDKAGWNGLGNGTLTHTQLNGLDDEAKVQMYDHGSNSFVGVYAKDFTYAVGTAFFYQAKNTNPLILSQADGSRVLRAPQREKQHVNEFQLSLTDEANGHKTDMLYVSADEDATGAYMVGRDLLKMSNPAEAKVAQMWTTSNGLTLCDIEVPLVNDKANCALGLYAPQAGLYELKIERAPEDADLYLTYEDHVVWDLTASPYTFDLNQGTTTGYGLRMKARAPQVATGVDEQNAEGQAMRKVIIDNTVYVITPDGKMYDIVGKSIK